MTRTLQWGIDARATLKHDLLALAISMQFTQARSETPQTASLDPVQPMQRGGGGIVAM